MLCVTSVVVLLVLQELGGQGDYSGAQERPVHKRNTALRRPVPQHKAEGHYSIGGRKVPTFGKVLVDRTQQLQLSVKNCFIRGSVVRYVQLPAKDVDVKLLQDSARGKHLLHTRD